MLISVIAVPVVAVSRDCLSIRAAVSIRATVDPIDHREDVLHVDEAVAVDVGGIGGQRPVLDGQAEAQSLGVAGQDRRRIHPSVGKMPEITDGVAGIILDEVEKFTELLFRQARIAAVEGVARIAQLGDQRAEDTWVADTIFFSLESLLQNDEFRDVDRADRSRILDDEKFRECSRKTSHSIAADPRRAGDVTKGRGGRHRLEEAEGGIGQER